MFQLAQNRVLAALMLAALAVGPLGRAAAQEYPRELVAFCSGFNAATGDPLPGGTGPVTVVSTTASATWPPPTTGTRKYAEFGSESLAMAKLDGPTLPETSAGSTWTYIRGRWPIKRTKKLVAAAWGTTAILESQTIGTYERHRVYVRNESTATTTTRVRVYLHINPPAGGVGGPFGVADITFTPTDPPWKYVETVLNPTTAAEGLGPVTGVSAPGAQGASNEWLFVNAIQGYADGPGMEFDVAFP